MSKFDMALISIAISFLLIVIFLTSCNANFNDKPEFIDADCRCYKHEYGELLWSDPYTPLSSQQYLQ